MLGVPNVDVLADKFIEKSKEAFSMAIEIYNKPTIKYRVEGFSLFICNAWELMLKSHIIKAMGIEKIYYPDNPSRTISLENCIRLVFTNHKAPLRKNIEKIMELRNISTHFIVEEYEMVYVPLFQACIFNFNEKMFEFHKVDMTDIIPQNFLTLAVSMKAFDENEIRAKYPEEIASKLIGNATQINDLSQSSNSSFSIRIEHYHYLTKDKSKATSIVGIDNRADAKVKIVRDVRNPNETHKFTAKKCIQEVVSRLDKANVNLKYNGDAKIFNSYHFDLFCKYYGIKNNEKLCFVNTINRDPTYSYSIKAIEFIVEEIKKDPDNIIRVMRSQLKKS